jgi:hypothetical protein
VDACFCGRSRNKADALANASTLEWNTHVLALSGVEHGQQQRTRSLRQCNSLLCNSLQGNGDWVCGRARFRGGGGGPYLQWNFAPAIASACPTSSMADRISFTNPSQAQQEEMPVPQQPWQPRGTKRLALRRLAAGLRRRRRPKRRCRRRLRQRRKEGGRSSLCREQGLLHRLIPAFGV